MNQELRFLNEQNKQALWAERLSDCRSSGQRVKAWCREQGICEQTYYKWQKRLLELAQSQQKPRFAEVTPVRSAAAGDIAVTVRMVGAEVEIHNGADAATVEAVLRVFKSC